jgi:hypothetical protein
MTTQSHETGADLAGFLQGEIARQRRRNRKTWTIGLVFTVILALYLGGIAQFLKSSVLDPRRAAEMASYIAQQHLPQILRDAEAELTASAPAVADRAVANLLTLPAHIGTEARGQINVVTDDMLPLLAYELTSTLQAHMEERAAKAATLLEGHLDEASVQAFVDQLASDVVEDLDREMQADSGEGIDHMLSMSLAALQDFNYQLKELNGRKPEELSREDQLHRRLLVLCMRALDEIVTQARHENGGAILHLNATL